MKTAFFSIAIDGPAGAGKSTVARALAAELNVLYLDTGAMYRAAALYCLESGQDPKNPTDLDALLDKTEVGVEYAGGTQKTLLNGKDVSQDIRKHEVSKAASDYSALPKVRIKLVELQRKIASAQSLVLDGRDIGSYVLPNATVKFFLTASAGERARRRHLELLEKGQATEYDEVLRDITERDFNDTNRAFAPLKKTEDAIEVNSDGLSAVEVRELMLKIIKEKIR